MTHTVGVALVLGCLLGTGLWSLSAAVPRLGVRRLSERIAPYLLDVSDEARQLTERRVADPLPVLGRLLGPILGHSARMLSAALGGNVSVEKWLAQSGSPLTVQQFRTRQVLAGLAGLVGGIGLGVALVQNERATIGLLMPVALAVAAIVSYDLLLRRRASTRVARISEEVPTVLEFLSLSLSAGEGIVDALRRVAHIGSGELSVELRRALVDTAAGSPVAIALTRCAARVDSPPLTRAVEQMCVAMLVPLVLLILPLSIAFALLPGIFVLRAGF